MSNESTLLLEIKRSPEDDGPRRRYAELMVAASHPRGRWAHAQLDAADPSLGAAERAAAAQEAAACFEAALSQTDTRARADLGRGRPARLAFLQPRPEAPEVCVTRLGLLSRLLNQTCSLETIYDLQYHRGMLTGIDVLRGVTLDVHGLTAVMGRAPVRWFGCPGSMLVAAARYKGLAAIHRLKLRGELSYAVLAETLGELPALRELDLSEAQLTGAPATRVVPPQLEVRWPDPSRPLPGLEISVWSENGASEHPAHPVRLLAPGPRGLLTLGQEHLSCWIQEGFIRGAFSLKLLKKALRVAQGRETGVWIGAGLARRRGAPVSLYQGSGEGPLRRVVGGVEAPEAVTISEEGRGAAWYSEAGGLEVLQASAGAAARRVEAPGAGYRALLWLPGDAALLGWRAEGVDRIALDGAGSGAASPVVDAAWGLCVVEGLEAPLEWPGTSQTPTLLICDAATAASVRRLDRGHVVGYSAARGVVALQSPLGLTLWSLRGGEALGVLPCEVDRAMLHPTLPQLLATCGVQVLSAALVEPPGRLDALPQLFAISKNAVAVDGPWGRYTFEGSFGSESGGDPWGGWESFSTRFALQRRGSQLWVLQESIRGHLGGEDITETWFTSLDDGRTFQRCERPSGEMEHLSHLSSVS